MTETLPDRVARFFGPAETAGLAVSGGGDSVALLCLAVEAGLRPAAVTVDHGLRPEAAAEADWVASLCDRLGVRHTILRWRGWDRSGNLQDEARRARLRLIADWAKGQGLSTVALAHTRDDQAETVLMRMARRGGVDGLSAMSAYRQHLGVTWARPLLDTGRQDLRDWLRARGQDWIEDPSNEALRFDRVKARRALTALAPLGITAPVLADIARQMQSVRKTLELKTAEVARAALRADRGDVLLLPAVLAEPDEIARRLLLAAISFVAPSDYPPRSAPVLALLSALRQGQGGTLAGCRFLRHGGVVRVTRELKAVGHAVAPGEVWDRRWRVFGPVRPGLEVGALGSSGLAQCRDWRAVGLPRPALLASPAVWSGDDLIAAPLARIEADWRAEPVRGAAELHLLPLSH